VKRGKQGDDVFLPVGKGFELPDQFPDLRADEMDRHGDIEAAKTSWIVGRVFLRSAAERLPQERLLFTRDVDI